MRKVAIVVNVFIMIVSFLFFIVALFNPYKIEDNRDLILQSSFLVLAYSIVNLVALYSYNIPNFKRSNNK